VRDEPDRGNVLLGRRRRNRRHDIPELVNGGVREPQVLQLGREIPQQHELRVGARVGGRLFVRLRVVADVLQETVKDIGHG
jgi:hypothetical protein